MKYILKINALGRYPEVDLGISGYTSIKNAKVKLSDGLAVEEKYEILISNYLEFENEILEYAAQSMIRNSYDYDNFFQVRMTFNQRLVNLLTAARLYIDQLPCHVRVIIADNPKIKEEIKSLFSKEYDNRLEYRFMEALRNYAQHRGMPVHWIQFSNHSDDSGKERLLIYSMELASQKRYLQEDGSFKKKVLKEIPEKLDLKMATRVYVESISRVHGATRKLVEGSLREARSIIENAIASYRKVLSRECVELHAICLDENRIVESVPILLDWDDIRLKLTKRNSELVNLRNRHVSGQIKTHNK